MARRKAPLGLRRQAGKLQDQLASQLDILLQQCQEAGGDCRQLRVCIGAHCTMLAMPAAPLESEGQSANQTIQTP